VKSGPSLLGRNRLVTDVFEKTRRRVCYGVITKKSREIRMKEEEIGGTCKNRDAGNKNCMHNFTGKTSRRRKFWKPTNGRESNMEMGLSIFVFND
jgi:hypothetical protein